MSWDTVSPTQSKNRYGNEYSKNTLPWHIFLWNDTMCPRSVYTHLWEFWETCFYILGNLDMMAQKKYFPPLKPGYLQLNFPEKHGGSLFSSLQQTIWWWFWVFWNKKEMCENTVKNHKTCFCELGNWTLLVNVTCSTCGSWIIVAPNCQKIHQFILLFITMTALVKFLSFLKKAGCLPLLVGKSSESTD